MRSLFQEKQRFAQWWLWLVIGSSSLAVIGIFLYGIYQQMVLRQPWGDTPMSDDVLVIVSLLAISLMTGVMLLFFNSVMETSVDGASVSYRYFPLIRSWRRIEKESILRFETRNALATNYGIARDLNGNRTLTVSGRLGILLTLHDGKTLLLGTQRPDEFIDALNKMKSGHTQ